MSPVSAGGLHTCGVRIDGTVACWGSNDTLDGRTARQAIPPAGQFASISAGTDHNCGVRRDGTVACWGSGDQGEATPPEGEFASVSAGNDHTCGVKKDGSVECWGFDRFSIDGVSIKDGGEFISQFAPPQGEFASVSTMRFTTCGVRTDGSVECWGGNVYGEATPPAGSSPPSAPGRPTPAE